MDYIVDDLGTAAMFRLVPDSTTATYIVPARGPRIVHGPRAGTIPARCRPYFRRCPCCGADVLDDPKGSDSKHGECCKLCHPRGDCPDCRTGAQPV